jgi:hypothetical protein
MSRYVPRAPLTKSGDEGSERGSVLLFAMLSLTVMSLLILTMATFTKTGIVAVGQLRNVRNSEFAASGTGNVTVQKLRYNSASYTTPAACSPGPSNVVTIGPSSMVAYCSGSYDFYSPTGATRTITVRVCTAGETMAQCTLGTGALMPWLTFVVVFDDWSAYDQNQCAGAQTSTCGTGMSVKSWVLR